MLNFNSVMIGTEDIQRLAAFYEKVFGKPADFVDGGYYGWQFGSMYFTMGSHSEVHGSSSEPPRIIMNFETTEVQVEFDRIKAAGATVIREPYELGGGQIATLADPDGNYFQLMTPMDMP
jgi:predicted enzyme related to lactoylglutathione lyase